MIEILAEDIAAIRAQLAKPDANHRKETLAKFDRLVEIFGEIQAEREWAIGIVALLRDLRDKIP